jgi:hypothetical protein
VALKANQTTAKIKMTPQNLLEDYWVIWQVLRRISGPKGGEITAG